MRFGFFSSYQEQLTYVAPGRFAGAAGRRFWNHGLVSWILSPHTHEYLASNTGGTPTHQALINTANAAFDPANGKGIIGATEDTRGYSKNGTSELVPPDKTVRSIFHKPYLLRKIIFSSLTGSGGSGGGSMFVGNLRIPYCINLENVTFLNGDSANTYSQITSITGVFPPRLTSLTINCNDTFAVASIEKPFPPSLQNLNLLSNSTPLGTQLNTLMAQATGLRNILFSEGNWNNILGGTLQRTPVPGTLTLVASAWKQLLIESSLTTDIDITALTDLNIERLKLRCGGLTGAKMLELVTLFCNSNVGSHLIINDSTRVFSKTFVDADFKSTLVYFDISGNQITGDITFTTARASLTVFDTGATDALRNNLGSVDISGATNVVTIDLTYSEITSLVLPSANITITRLSIGGNKIDATVNTSLITQIRAMTNLDTLELAVGSVAQLSNIYGQNSTNGLGTIDLSTLTKLITLRAWAPCGLTGNIKLPVTATLINVLLSYNNLTGIDTGSISQITTLNVEYNPLFTFDFSRIPNIRWFDFSGTAIVTLDLSGRTATNSLIDVFARECPNLTTVIFPAAANCIMSVSTGNVGVISLFNNPNLTTLTNLTNVTWTTQATARSVSISGCAVNADIGLGINNFTPTGIGMHNNAMSNANVNANISSLYTNRRKYDTTPFSGVARSLNISGTNAAPSGTYQANTTYKIATITGATKANPCVVTVSAIGTLVNDDVIRIRNVNGMTLNNITYMIKNISGNTFQLYNEAGTTPIDSTGFATYTSGGNVYVEGTPATEKEQVYVLVNVYAWTVTMN